MLFIMTTGCVRIVKEMCLAVWSVEENSRELISEMASIVSKCTNRSIGRVTFNVLSADLINAMPLELTLSHIWSPAIVLDVEERRTLINRYMTLSPELLQGS